MKVSIRNIAGHWLQKGKCNSASWSTQIRLQSSQTKDNPKPSINPETQIRDPKETFDR